MNKKPNSKIATLYVILWYTVYIIYYIPVVPHKAVAEVSRIGNV